MPARHVVLAVVCVLSIAAASPLRSAPVPPVMKFSGVLSTVAGPAALTFALYVDQAGGMPLWTETQNLIVEPGGRYAVVLGATRPDGLPSELFAEGEARWIGVTVVGGDELPRVMMISVPYAFKAGDAATIGGKPLSAFVLAGETTGVGEDGLTYVDMRVLRKALQEPGTRAAAASSTSGGAAAATANRLPRFADSGGALADSALFQDTVNAATMNFVGVNTTAPEAQFHVQGTAAPVAFFDVISNSLSALPAVYRAARGTPASLSAVQTNDILGGLAVRGYHGTGYSGGRGQVMFRAAENWTTGANGTYLQFATTPTGGTQWTERMRIDPSGQVLIGDTVTGPDAIKLRVDDAETHYYGVYRPAVVTSRSANGNPAISANAIGTGNGLVAITEAGYGVEAHHASNTGTSGSVAGPSYGLFGASDLGGGHAFGYLGNSTYGGYAYHSDGVAFRADSGSDTAIWANSTTGYGIDARTSGAARAALVATSYNAGAYGVLANNTASGTSARLATPSNAGEFVGSVTVTGRIYAGPGLTGTPIASAFVYLGGELGAHTSNVSVSKTGSGTYEISVDGYSILTDNSVSIVTQASGTPGSVVAWPLGNGVLRVSMYNLAGNLRDVAFSIAIFAQ